MSAPISRLTKLAADARAQYYADLAAGAEPVWPAWVDDIDMLIVTATGRPYGGSDTDYALRRANMLIAYANAAGLVVRIETEPLQPLAMGNYKMVATVQPARVRS